MAMSQVQFNLSMVDVDCCKCGITFCVPHGFDRQRLKDKKSFYCPNGHGQIYKGESDAKKVERLQQRLEWKQSEVDRSKKYVSGILGQKTKMENRVRKGLCPFCRRNFSDLRSHMAGKHNREKK